MYFVINWQRNHMIEQGFDRSRRIAVYAKRRYFLVAEWGLNRSMLPPEWFVAMRIEIEVYFDVRAVFETRVLE